MIYLKSFLAGVMGVVLMAVILWLIFIGVPALRVLTRTDDGIGVYEVGPFSIWPVVIGGSVVFTAAFYWTFRRGSKSARRS